MEIYSKTRTGDKQTSFEMSGRGIAPEAQNANWREHINALWETRPCYFCHKQIPIFLEIETNTKHPGFCSGLVLNVTRGSVSIYPRYKQENLSAKICSLAKAAQQLLFRDLLHKIWHIHKIYTRDLGGGTNWRRISLKQKKTKSVHLFQDWKEDNSPRNLWRTKLALWELIYSVFDQVFGTDIIWCKRAEVRNPGHARSPTHNSYSVQILLSTNPLLYISFSSCIGLWVVVFSLSCPPQERSHHYILTLIIELSCSTAVNNSKPPSDVDIAQRRSSEWALEQSASSCVGSTCLWHKWRRGPAVWMAGRHGNERLFFSSRAEWQY